MNATSAQQAALHVLLEDVEPLLQRAEETARLLTTVREELHGDLERLGRLVQQTVDAQPSLLETGRRLGASAARIEALSRPTSPAAPAPAALRRGVSWRLCALSATLAAAATAVLLWAVSQQWQEHAQLGRALQSAWPALDAPTRMKLSERLGRSS